MAGTARPLCLGATLTVAEYALPEQMAAYLAAHPDEQIRVTVANTQELLAGLDRGTLDFALVEGYFTRGDYDCLLYSQEPYVAVCAPNYPLPPAPCRLEDLLDRRLILRESGSGTRGILAVSYTHLDVYKRQSVPWASFWARGEGSHRAATRQPAMRA